MNSIQADQATVQLHNLPEAPVPPPSPTPNRYVPIQTSSMEESGCWAFLKKVFYCIFYCLKPEKRATNPTPSLSERVSVPSSPSSLPGDAATPPSDVDRAALEARARNIMARVTNGLNFLRQLPPIVAEPIEPVPLATRDRIPEERAMQIETVRRIREQFGHAQNLPPSTETTQQLELCRNVVARLPDSPERGALAQEIAQHIAEYREQQAALIEVAALRTTFGVLRNHPPEFDGSTARSLDECRANVARLEASPERDALLQEIDEHITETQRAQRERDERNAEVRARRQAEIARLNAERAARAQPAANGAQRP